MHSSVIAIIDRGVPEDQLYFELERVMAPFDENLEVPRYMVYTREEFIAQERQDIQYRLDMMLEEYNKDPELFVHTYTDLYIPQLKAKLVASDDEVWNHGAGDYADEELDSDGNIYSTVNLVGKWDYWLRGGRYQHCILNSDGLYDKNGNLATKGCDTLRKKDLTAMVTPYAVVDKEGNWHDSVSINGLDWLDQPAPNTEEYQELRGIVEMEFFNLINNAHPEDWLCVLDAHC